MLSRSAGASASPRVAATVASSSPTKSRRMALWISISVDTTDPIACDVDQLVCMARFFHQHTERRHVLVPFNQGRHRAKPAQRFLVERPHLADYTRAMIINP